MYHQYLIIYIIFDLKILGGGLLFQTSDCDIRCVITTMDITPDGRYIITGDSAKSIKV